MKKQLFGFLLAFVAVSFFFTACDKQSDPFGIDALVKSDFELPGMITWSADCGEPLSTVLVAGKDATEIGLVNVSVSEDGKNLLVAYLINDPAMWTILSTHLSITTSADAEGIPNTVPGYPSNPKIGLFNFNDWPDVSNNVYTIPLTEFDGAKDFYILAHADVKNTNNCGADLDAFASLIPNNIVTGYFTEPGLESYFLIDLLNAGSLTADDYEGWCLDLTHSIGDPPCELNLKMISTYQSDFSTLGLVDYPENIKALNWVLNQHFVGMVHPTLGTFNFHDVQYAIWELIEEFRLPTPDYAAAKVDYIVSEALKHLDYVPGCGDLVGIILYPVDESGAYANKQITLISYPMPCECDAETAWGAGFAFPGDSWAMFFRYCVN